MKDVLNSVDIWRT